MKLLVDNQLPIGLPRHLILLGWQAEHVYDLGLDSATDRAIWQYAISEGMVIVTKDRDFAQLAKQQSSIPPQVIWVRLGNCRRQDIFDAFSRESRALLNALTAGIPVVELG